MFAIAAPVLMFNVSTSAVVISAVPVTVISVNELSVPLKVSAVKVPFTSTPPLLVCNLGVIPPL
jgi:hypothetical protein